MMNVTRLLSSLIDKSTIDTNAIRHYSALSKN
jgi:hypothetical protein